MEVERIVRTQVTSGELEPPTELVQSVNAGQTHLLDIVKALGEYLTATEDDVRLKGLTFLSNLIKVVDPTKINRPAARTLTGFYLSKLDDFDSLPPSLNALLVLSKQTTFDDDTAVEVYRAIVESVNMKAYVQSTRHLVYTLFDSLLAHHRKAFIDMGSDFISSFTKMVDGEKDPRNLMLLFSIERVLLLEFDVKAQIEELFDVTFCYFPITFRPPPNDPYGITADDLKLALRSCMSASPHFSKMAIPLFLEKFATSTGQTMKDLLLTMGACFPVYGAVAVSERGEELWEAIKTEVLYSSDATIESAALTALESLIRTVYPTANDTPSGLAQEIIKQCLESLSEPEKNQAAGSAKSLAAMIRASPSAGPFALSQALPQLFRQFNRPLLPSHRAPLLNSLTTLLLAARSVYAVPASTRRQDQERSLEPFREALLDVLREGLRTEGLKTAAIRGCVALIEIPGYWGKREVEEVVKGMDELLINEGDSEVMSVVIDGLATISTAQPAVIESITLPLLFHTLPDEAPTLSNSDARDKYRNILASLSELCTLPALFEPLLIRITAKLDLLSGIDLTSESDVNPAASRRECTVAYAWDLLHTLKGVLDTKLEKKHVDVVKYYEKLAPRLFGLVVSAAMPRAGSSTPLFRDRRLIGIVAGIAETLVWELNEDRQAKILAAMYAAFEGGELGGIVFDAAAVQNIGPSAPLRPMATSPEQDLVVIYSAILQGTKPNTLLPFTSSADFLTSKVHWAVRVARDDFQLSAALDLISAFVNKHTVDIGSALDPLLEHIWMMDIQDTTQPHEIRRRGLLVYLHMVKALAMIRNDIAYTAIDRIVDVLSLSNFDPAFVNEAARGFGVLAEGGSRAKSKGKGVHLTVKLLYAQKLWNFLFPKLIEGDKEAEGNGRLAYLIAFSSLLPLIPASLCLSDLPTILPLLLRSLALPSPVQRTNVIIALTSILETANSSTAIDSLLHSNAEAMVDGLLSSAIREPGQATSSKVRAAALAALSVFPDTIRYETLGSAKARVLRQLGATLDDPLRSVRREAVDCRAKWYRYGGL